MDGEDELLDWSSTCHVVTSCLQVLVYLSVIKLMKTSPRQQKTNVAKDGGTTYIHSFYFQPLLILIIEIF